MLANVFAKSLRDQRRALLGWGSGTVFLLVVMGAFWPSVRDMPDLSEFVASYPEAMRDLFSMEEFATGAGYMNAEVFSSMLPVLMVIYAIGRGARLVAGEEEAGTLDVLLVTRVSPVRLVLQQAAALAVSLTILSAVAFGGTMLVSASFDMGLAAGDVAGACLAMVLLSLEYGWLALAVGAATGRRAAAIAVATIAAVAAYVLYAAGVFVDALEPWQPFSPFHQALDSGPLGAGLPLGYGWLLAGAAVFIGAALPIFNRRDIAAH
jgi:ABC-2 type transport system permease protein